ncbi:hypothetical protein A2U01_0110742, partial [Trifolium medium]|nr:hypothetical protein [Trifolium medium]
MLDVLDVVGGVWRFETLGQSLVPVREDRLLLGWKGYRLMGVRGTGRKVLRSYR